MEYLNIEGLQILHVGSKFNRNQTLYFFSVLVVFNFSLDHFKINFELFNYSSTVNCFVKMNGPQILARVEGTNNDEFLQNDNYKYDWP